MVVHFIDIGRMSIRMIEVCAQIHLHRKRPVYVTFPNIPAYIQSIKRVFIEIDKIIRSGVIIIASCSFGHLLVKQIPIIRFINQPDRVNCFSTHFPLLIVYRGTGTFI